MDLAKILRVSRFAILVLIMLGPVTAWLITGPVEPFEGRSQTEFPEAIEVLSPDMDGRTQLADAIIERSWMRRTSLTLRNGFDYFLFGQAEFANALSGRDGWLFYLPQFTSWRCSELNAMRNGIEALRFQAQFAEAGDIPILFAIAPNKASVEVDHLGGRAARVMDECYAIVQSGLRQAASEDTTGRIVDHTARLQSLDSTDEPRFFLTDTHWRPRAGLMAFNQLMTEPAIQPGIPLVDPEFEPHSQWTDIGGRVLTLPIREPTVRPVTVNVDWAQTDAAAYPENVVISHDSFYVTLNRLFASRLRNAIMVRQGSSDDAGLADSLEVADLVIVERVERHLLGQFLDWGEIAGKTEIHRWLLDRSARTAQSCAWDEAISLMPDQPETSAEFRRMEADGAGGMQTSAANARIHFTPPAGWADAPVCFRAQLTATADEQSWLFVPGALLLEARYVNGRSVHIPLQEGENEIAFVLPASVAGENLRWDPVRSNRPVTVTSLEIAPRHARDTAGQDN